MHHLPLATFEVQDVGRTPVETAARRGNRLSYARPANGPLLPGLDFVTCDREGTELLELPRPDGAGLVSVPPLIWIVPDDERVRMVRQARERGLVVSLDMRARPSLDKPANLLRGLHAREGVQ